MAMNATASGLSRPESAALRLLKKVMATRWFRLDALARALSVPEADINAYLSGTDAIPLDRQLRIAQFVIDCVPPFARLGHRLRGQATAAIAFHARTTETHLQPPPPTRY
jgi:hypothetical protein